MLLFRSMSVMENLLIAPRAYPGESILRVAFGRGEIRRCGGRRCARARDGDPRRAWGWRRPPTRWSTDLPFGQQKLVGLARTLMNDGAVLLLDEPMAGVEGAAYETMQRDRARGGRSRPRGLRRGAQRLVHQDLCTRAVFMARGSILQTGSVDELLASNVLTELYFGV